MEKYEMNKFKSEYEVKLIELCTALGIDAKRPKLESLEKEINAANFWDDQDHAQATINQMNSIKETIFKYDSIQQKFKDIIELMDMALEDAEAMELLESLIEDFKNDMNALEEQALLSGKYDEFDCILELHPGAGGTESMDWADMLYRMYTRYCAKKGFKLKVIDYLPGDEAGIKSITISISGAFAYGLFKAERGVHRLVRISPFDSNARRHTSFVSCDVSPQIPEAEEVVVKDEDIKIDVYHSSGAGGQSVNTTDSAVRITHKPTGIV
ncbi:MAG: PCRF domain-containing protein, partial [Anaeroplasmataceae bacterium]|nr:PCRF domain-containing protein [Anaeroplasmataceae bacterium]